MLFYTIPKKTDKDEEISKNCVETISVTNFSCNIIFALFCKVEKVGNTTDKKDKEARDGFLRRQSF